MKIRVKLSAWYFATTLAILLCFSFGAYWGMQGLLLSAVNEELNFFLDEIEQSYRPADGTFTSLGKNLLTDRHYLKFYLIVYDADGDEIFRSPLAQNISLDIPLPEHKIEQSFTLHKTLLNMPALHYNVEKNVAFQAVSRQLFKNENQVGWASIALPVTSVEKTLAHLLKTLVLSFVAITAVVSIGSYFLTSRTLKPIDKITIKARKISESNLNERLEVDQNDELGRLSIVLNDLLARLQKAFESQQQFMADAAHELKTPLTILRTHWDNELDNTELSVTMKEKIIHDIETLSRLNKLINNLLLLSQTETVQAAKNFSLIRLDELLLEIVSDVEVLAGLRNQNIEAFRLVNAVVEGDRDRLYELFFNVLDNAVKYTQTGGKITVTMDVDAQEVIVKIRDNGPGIPEKDLPYIFERFYRIEKDRSRKTGGAGLGLAICRLIAILHNGSIMAENAKEGGAVFTIKLPVYIEQKKLKNIVVDTG
ncbi:MAG: HAMP domain-containing histidine kinase [Deferribacteres bacterium]|nr:HAMP domain-containing histidine kinase [Deferribacteres bacterium]